MKKKQQQAKEPITTTGEREFDDFPDEDMESELNWEEFFVFIWTLWNIELIDDTTTTTKTNVTSASVAPKEKKNVVF